MPPQKVRNNTLDLSIVIPAYNEADTISGMIAATNKAISKSSLNFEILIIDDGSQDSTREVIQGIKNPRLHLFTHPYNKGNGSAIKTGIHHAKGKYIVCLDADGQHDPNEILKLYEHANQYDLVVGARTKQYQSTNIRWLGNFVFNALASSLTKFKIEDLTSGFRIFRAHAIKQYIDLLPPRFSYPTTSTLIFLKAGYSVKYVPVKMLPRTLGSSKIRVLRDGWRFVVIILKIIVLFEPLQIFLPATVLFLSLALVSTAYSIFSLQRLFIPNSGILFFSMSTLIFLLGLIAEQIATLQIVASKHDS